MKTASLFVFLLIIAFTVDAQDINEVDELYLIAIEKDLEEYDRFIAENIGIKKPERLFIQTNANLKNCPEIIQGLPIYKLTNKNVKKIFKANGKKLSFIKLEPIKLDQGNLIITITKINGYYKNNHFILPHGDWTDVYFQFDCDIKKWVYYKTELRGI